MLAVACGMADEGNNGLSFYYAEYVEHCNQIGMEALSEFDWTNRHVVKGWWNRFEN
jgi:hypothetical protein